jgi:GTPase Era involved in 16S rRNA processing
MAQNIFEELQVKKQNLVLLAKKASDFGWITPERLKEITAKIDSDVLTIGVIGQMKCGKSTFLNSFVFEKDVLPAATTPMTAALSVITYGEKEKIVADFYSNDEWEEQRMMASRSLEDVQGNNLEESKIKAAKELMERSVKLGGAIRSYLGKTKSDNLDNLEKYVGAEGEFVSITKSVTIYYPKEYLKGVEIVDTPGFNDPIVSREERTKKFLKKADVVLLMLYAGRPFDATDRDILFKNVRQCGIGKVILGINKYDIPYGRGETEKDIAEYVKEEIKKACKACRDDTLVDILKQADPIPLSAEMALLSVLPTTVIASNEAYKHALMRAYETFEISSPQQLRQKSLIDDLTNAVRKVIEAEKGHILFTKPLNVILAAGNEKLFGIGKSYQECINLIENLNIPDEELEEKLDRLARAEKKLNKKIDVLGDELDSSFKNIVRKGSDELEDEVDKTCKKMKSIVNDWGIWKNVESISPDLDAETQKLTTRTLKRKMKELSEDAKGKILKSVNEFLNDAQEIFMRYIPDFDYKDTVKNVMSNIQIDIDEGLFSYDADNDGDGEEDWGDILFAFLDGASWGTLSLGGNLLSHADNVKKLSEYINSISRDFDPKPYLENIYQHKDQIIDIVKKAFISEILNPMQEQIEEIRSKISDKEKQLADAKSKCEELKKNKAVVEQQVKEVNTIINAQL